MKRLLLVWLALSIPLATATLLIELLAFKRLEMTYLRHFQLVVIPLFQAFVVLWATGAGGNRRPLSTLWETPGRSWLAGMLLLETVVILVGWHFAKRQWLGMLGADSLHPAWTALLAGLAGLAVSRLLWRLAQGWRERLWLLLLAVLLFAFASDTFYPWLTQVPGWLPKTIPMPVRALLLMICAFYLTLGILIRVGGILRSHVRASGTLLEGAALVLFLLGNIFLLDLYQAYYSDTSKLIYRSGASLSLMLILAGSLLCLFRARRDPTV